MRLRRRNSKALSCQVLPSASDSALPRARSDALPWGQTLPLRLPQLLANTALAAAACCVYVWLPAISAAAPSSWAVVLAAVHPLEAHTLASSILVGMAAAGCLCPGCCMLSMADCTAGCCFAWAGADWLATCAVPATARGTPTVGSRAHTGSRYSYLQAVTQIMYLMYLDQKYIPFAAMSDAMHGAQQPCHHARPTSQLLAAD